MKKLFLKAKKGFTLVEVIVVLAIIAILLAITVPAISGYIGEAEEAKYMAQARSVFIVAEVEKAKKEDVDFDTILETLQENSGLGDALEDVSFAGGVYTIVLDGATVTVEPNKVMTVERD